MKKTSTNGAKKRLDPKPKKTRQGKSINTKLSATPSKPKQKAYRGQGK